MNAGPMDARYARRYPSTIASADHVVTNVDARCIILGCSVNQVSDQVMPFSRNLNISRRCVGGVDKKHVMRGNSGGMFLATCYLRTVATARREHL